jgi:hypothetical protein
VTRACGNEQVHNTQHMQAVVMQRLGQLMHDSKLVEAQEAAERKILEAQASYLPNPRDGAEQGAGNGDTEMRGED